MALYKHPQEHAFCSCEPKCTLPHDKSTRGYTQYQWGNSILCPSFRKSFPELNDDEELQMLYTTFNANQSEVMHRRKPGLTKSQFIQSLIDIGITIGFEPDFETDTKSFRIPTKNFVFEGNEVFGIKPKYTSDLGDGFSFLLNHKEYTILSDEDFENFTHALMADVLCITNAQGKTSFLWFDDKERFFKIIDMLPATQKFPLEVWKRAREEYSTRRSFIDKQEVFV